MVNLIKQKKALFAFVFGLVFALIGAIWTVGQYFLNFALKRGTEIDPKAPPKASAGIITPNLLPPDKPKFLNDCWTIQVDSEKRVATAFYANQKSDKWIIMVHGYCRDQRYVWDYAERYLKQGYNVLTPDLNASGSSEGTYLTMGVKESKDIEFWTRLLVKKYYQSKIALHGVSMGAATVMLATHKELPKNVYAVIEDCGYSSAYEMFSSQLEKMFGLPPFPVLDMVNIVQRIKLGCYMSDAAPINIISKNKLPTLFIHGSLDGLVPLSMMETLYANAGAKYKEKMIVQGASHADSMKINKEEYFNRVFSFLDKAENIDL